MHVSPNLAYVLKLGKLMRYFALRVEPCLNIVPQDSQSASHIVSHILN
jgi:hypothetical protein